MKQNDEARIARTESVFRHVNERIAETTETFNTNESVLVCECADPDCHHKVQVPLDTYEQVRSKATRFVVAPGHEEPGYERVVEQRRGYAIVEKVARRLAAMVRRSDPRAEPS